MPRLPLLVAVATAIAVTPALAASPTSPQAVLAAALDAYAAGNFVVAARDFRQLAGDGSAIAETMLGAIYAHGQGVRRDPAVAAAYYCRAAHRGYAPAQLALARAFARGQGVVADRGAAWHWLRLAAERGDARVVASAKAEAAELAAAAPAPPDDTADWQPWPSAGE